jgi:O-antigen/teichoic acid export membrane protein
MSVPTASRRASTSEIVTHNLLWTIAELSSVIATMLIVNIGMARVIGPRPLGYFNLVFWLTNVTGQVGSLGLPATTCKYMAEYIGADRSALARAVFFYSLRLQTIISGLMTALGIIAVFVLVDPEYRISSFFLVLSLLPQMLAFIPSQANNAREDVRGNLPGSVIGCAIHVVAVLASLIAGWGLVGVAIGVFASRTIELVLKLAGVFRWIRRYERGWLSTDIKRRLMKFSGFSTAAILLQVIVWDRSDIVLLKVLQPDIRQITFFSISFGLADRLLRLPQALGNAVAVTQLAVYGRDRQRLSRITATSARYIFTAAAPMLLAAAAMSAPSIYTMYGRQYLAAIPVFALVAVFAVPKSITTPAQTMLYATGDLGFLVKWSCLCGAINVSLDYLLIPAHGAAGAAIGNGVAQTVAAAGIWFRTVRHHNVSLDWPVFARTSAAALSIAALVCFAARVRATPMLQFAISAGVAVTALPITLRLFHVLSRADAERARMLLRRLPAPLQHWLNLVVGLAVMDRPTEVAT